MRFRYLVPVGLVASLLWFSLPWAQAHADLVSSKPAVDSHLASLPSRVEVTFDGDLLVIGRSKTNVLIVKNSQGIQIDAKDSKVSGATMSVGLNPDSKPGTFTVSWRVVSGDGHPEANSYQFTVGQPIASSPTQSPSAATSSLVKTSRSHDFWARYGTQLMLAFVAVVGVGIWVRFERKRRITGSS